MILQNGKKLYWTTDYNPTRWANEVINLGDYMTTPGTETVTPAQTLTADVTSPIVTDGTQPVVTSPVVDGSPAAPVAVVEETPTVTTAAEPGDDAPKVTPKWAQDRINELTAKRYEAERSAKADREARLAAEELLSKFTTGQTPPTPATTPAAPQQPGLTEAEVQRRATEMAQQIARQTEFNNACNKVADAGQKEFKDWTTALGNLAMVGATGEGSNPEFLETAIELKSPEKVLHYLGTNLDQAKRLVEMPGKKMALELARLEAQLNAPAAPTPAPAVSSAPAPIIPVAGGTKAAPGDINDPNLTPDEWFALRSKQIAERKSRYLRA